VGRIGRRIWSASSDKSHGQSISWSGSINGGRSWSVSRSSSISI
jgi:hypothetical protein